MTCGADGDADAAVEARIQSGWNNFRKLVPLYSSCVENSMLYGSETLVGNYSGFCTKWVLDHFWHA